MAEEIFSFAESMHVSRLDAVSTIVHVRNVHIRVNVLGWYANVSTGSQHD